MEVKREPRPRKRVDASSEVSILVLMEVKREWMWTAGLAVTSRFQSLF